MNKIGKYTAALLAVTTLTIAACASTATSEGTGEYVDDTVITTKVKTAILNDPRAQGRGDQCRDLQGCRAVERLRQLAGRVERGDHRGARRRGGQVRQERHTHQVDPRPTARPTQSAQQRVHTESTKVATSCRTSNGKHRDSAASSIERAKRPSATRARRRRKVPIAMRCSALSRSRRGSCHCVSAREPWRSPPGSRPNVPAAGEQAACEFGRSGGARPPRLLRKRQ